MAYIPTLNVAGSNPVTRFILQHSRAVFALFLLVELLLVMRGIMGMAS